MKLKTILGVCTAIASTMLLSCVVFAAPKFEMGTPIDLKTGSEISEYTKGEIIAIPVDLYTDSTSDSVANYSLSLKYDSSVLKPYGLDYDNETNFDILDNFDALGGTAANNLHDSTDLKIYAINNFRNANGRRVMGSGSYTKTDATTMCGMGVLSINSAVNNNYPVAYFLFEVIDTVSPDVLNSEVIKLNEDASYGGASITLVGGAEAALDGTIEKANACDGAFKIVVKDSELPYYVQGITLTIDGKYTNSGKTENFELDACESAEGEGYTEYSFPVRLISAKDDTEVVASITAKVSDVLDGSVNLVDADWGSVTVSMTNPTTYTTAEGNDYTGPVRP